MLGIDYLALVLGILVFSLIAGVWAEAGVWLTLGMSMFLLISFNIVSFLVSYFLAPEELYQETTLDFIIFGVSAFIALSFIIGCLWSTWKELKEEREDARYFTEKSRQLRENKDKKLHNTF